ncbi:MAG: TetR/AcrR family transcriptional regulator [Haloechinothrix sp.]
MRAGANAGTGASRPRNRKEMILQAATELFVREGYHRTAMGDIAATLGITSTALYRHYRNKQELLARSLLDGLDLVRSAITGAVEADDQLGTLIDALTALSLEHRGRAALWQRELRHLPDEDRRAATARLANANDQVRSVIMAARPELDEDDAELLTWCLGAVFESVSYHRVLMSRDRFAALLTELAFRAVRADLPQGRRNACGIELDEAHRVGLHDLSDQMSRRERLIAVATQLFDRRGYAAVGIEDIGAAAGITGPSVYYHFQSKAELLTEIVERGAKAIDYYIAKAVAEGKNPADTLERMARYYALFAHVQRDLVGVIVGEVIHLPPDAAARYRDVQREGIMRWTAALRAVRPELDAGSARVTIQAVIMAVNDAVRLPQLTRRPHLVDELVAVSMAMMAT